MNNFDITTAWAFDGSGNNWVSYPKGYNSDGKALENGLYKGGHAFGCPGDLQGIEAEKAIKTGKIAKNATKKGKGETFANQSDVVFAPVADYPAPSIEWDADAVADTVKTQVATFGKVSYGVKGTTTSKKIAYKEAALDKSLDAAFKTKKNNTDWLSLDTVGMEETSEASWLVDESSDPMDALIEEENEMEAMMAKAKSAITSDEWEMVVAKANGATQTEMAETFGFFDNSGVSKKFKTIYKKVSKATGVAFVA